VGAALRLRVRRPLISHDEGGISITLERLTQMLIWISFCDLN
jgi:hypothetical protein